MTNAHIEFAGITKSYGPTKIIGDTSVSIGEGEFVSLLGPSGSGKSTMLNMIAGLAFPSTGEVRARGEAVTGPGPDRGVVFQNHALLPWMTARGNIEFGLRSARPELSKAERTQIAQDFLDEVSLGHAADRRPSRLSGGMQQRVGLARAFAIGSDILLLDEPFGALDALTRGVIQDELIKIWSATKQTVFMITHDIDEAVKLGDWVVVFDEGAHIQQYDRPERILAEPANDFVADFVGSGAGLKRLGLRSVDSLPLRPIAQHPTGTLPGGPVLDAATPISEALAVLVTAPAEEIAVVRDGTVIGLLDYPTLRAHARAGDEQARP